MTNRPLVFVINLVIVVFATFGHYFLNIAPPEESGKLIIQLCSFLAFCFLFFLISARNDFLKTLDRKLWIISSLIFTSLTILSGAWYTVNFSNLTIGLPPENPEVFLVRGTEWTEDAIAWLEEVPNASPAEVSLDFGPSQTGRDRTWTEESVTNAKFLLTTSFILMVLSFAGSVFCICEGLLFQTSTLANLLLKNTDSSLTHTPDFVEDYKITNKPTLEKTYVKNQSAQLFNQKLHHVLIDRFNIEELRTLCLYLDIDYENLSGEGKSAMARELITYVERNGKVDLLINEIRNQRGNII